MWQEQIRRPQDLQRDIPMMGIVTAERSIYMMKTVRAGRLHVRRGVRSIRITVTAGAVKDAEMVVRRIRIVVPAPAVEGVTESRDSLSAAVGTVTERRVGLDIFAVPVANREPVLREPDIVPFADSLLLRHMNLADVGRLVTPMVRYMAITGISLIAENQKVCIIPEAIPVEAVGDRERLIISAVV